MIEGLGHTGDEGKCSVCECLFTEDEGGIQGYFGILPVEFCPTCYASMYDMVEQDMDVPEDLEELIELKGLVKDFFDNYLDVQEESDSGRLFNPITVSCVRAMKLEPLSNLLEKMKEISHN